MKRPLATVAALLASCAAGLAVSPSPAAAAPPPRAQLAGFACNHALQPAGRTVGIQAVMRPLPDTWRMAVRFDLLAPSRRGAAPGTIRGHDLSTWISPNDPTLGRLPGDVWRLDKTVLNLPAPAVYRLRVSFRWTNAAGRIIGTAVRLSPVCAQRELRPDLLVRSVTVAPGADQPGQDVYQAVITNAGATGAGPFQVLLTPGDNAAPAVGSIHFLGGGRTSTVTFTAPACDPADLPTLIVDAAHQVDDFNRGNNAVTIACPAPAATGPGPG